MPNNLKNATQPVDTSNMKIVAPPPARPLPPLNDSADPEFNPLSLGPVPSILGTDTDAARQFYRKGVSQLRMSPLPALASPATGAQIASHVAPVADAADAANKGVTTINAQTVAVVSGGVIVQQAIGDSNDGALTPTLDNLMTDRLSVAW